MKKAVLVILLLAAVFVGTASAEVDFTSYSPAFGEGDMAVQVGLSLLTFYYFGDVLIPPISVAFDYAIPVADFPFSFGGIAGVSVSRADYFTYRDTYTYILIAGRAAYHVDFGKEKIDAYTGVQLGLNYYIYSSENEFITGNFNSGSLLWGGFVGGRYFFTDSLAAFIELGYGLGVFTGGVTLKL